MTDNPYEVLQLSPEAGEAEIVARAALLCQRTPDEAARGRYRQAAVRLTASLEQRRLFALLTHPHPDPAGAERQRFIAAFRRPPAGITAALPGVDVTEFDALLRDLLARDLDTPAGPFEAVAAGVSAEEIARQTAEALWQRLLAEPGG